MSALTVILLVLLAVVGTAYIVASYYERRALDRGERAAAEIVRKIDAARERGNR